MKGHFITFEGVEGAGKSTQIKKTADYLQLQKLDVLMTREPGGSTGAETIRELLVKGDIGDWTDMTECLLMNAARNEHLEKKIRPSLERGHFVLCDRFMDSTRAYQGGAGGIDMAAILAVEALVVQDTRPDLTLIFDLGVEAGLQRATERGGDDRFEKKGRDYHERVRTAFLKIARAEPERCAIINADQKPEEVFNDVLKVLQKRLKLQ